MDPTRWAHAHRFSSTRGGVVPRDASHLCGTPTHLICSVAFQKVNESRPWSEIFFRPERLAPGDMSADDIPDSARHVKTGPQFFPPVMACVAPDDGGRPSFPPPTSPLPTSSLPVSSLPPLSPYQLWRAWHPMTADDLLSSFPPPLSLPPPYLSPPYLLCLPTSPYQLWRAWHPMTADDISTAIGRGELRGRSASTEERPPERPEGMSPKNSILVLQKPEAQGLYSATRTDVGLAEHNFIGKVFGGDKGCVILLVEGQDSPVAIRQSAVKYSSEELFQRWTQTPAYQNPEEKAFQVLGFF